VAGCLLNKKYFNRLLILHLKEYIYLFALITLSHQKPLNKLYPLSRFSNPSESTRSIPKHRLLPISLKKLIAVPPVPMRADNFGTHESNFSICTNQRQPVLKRTA
jgi:hypothetical protein